MWIIYTVNCQTDKDEISFCCYTHDFEKAINALDDYSIARYRQKNPDFPKDVSPLDDDTDMSAKDGYYLRLDLNYINGHGDSERINLYKSSKSNIHLLRYFQIATVDKYIDDYMSERTQAVIDLERDAKIDPALEVIKEEISSSDESYEEVSSDEYLEDD